MAKALPVGSIPEQNHVTTVRDDVVYISRHDHAAFLLAVNAQRMLGQVALARLLPPVGVAALVAGTALLLGCRVPGRGW